MEKQITIGGWPGLILGGIVLVGMMAWYGPEYLTKFTSRSGYSQAELWKHAEQPVKEAIQLHYRKEYLLPLMTQWSATDDASKAEKVTQLTQAIDDLLIMDLKARPWGGGAGGSGAKSYIAITADYTMDPVPVPDGVTRREFKVETRGGLGTWRVWNEL
ncbi:MAG: hypothetical protein ACPGUC_01040 [Gammaproteobacteria bacterium]